MGICAGKLGPNTIRELSITSSYPTLYRLKILTFVTRHFIVTRLAFVLKSIWDFPALSVNSFEIKRRYMRRWKKYTSDIFPKGGLCYIWFELLESVCERACDKVTTTLNNKSKKMYFHLSCFEIPHTRHNSGMFGARFLVWNKSNERDR